MAALPRLAAGLLLVLLSFAAAAAAVASGPKLEHGGRTEPAYAPSFAAARFRAASVGADGSILASRSDYYEGTGVTVNRYLANGRLDPSFEPEVKGEVPEAVDSKGRTVRVASGNTFERLNPDGSVDASLGHPGSEHPQSEAVYFSIEAILPLATGAIIVAGTEPVSGGDSEARAEIVLARYDEAGKLDPGFGRQGVVRLAREGGVVGEELVGLLPGPADDVLVALNDEATAAGGETLVQSASRVVAVGGDGRLDPGFAGGGTYSSPDSIGAFEALPGGGLLLAGARWGARLDRTIRDGNVYLARLTPDGALDPSFGERQGMTIVDLGGIDVAHAVLVRSDGSIVVGGATTAPTLGCPQYGDPFCTETPVLAAFTPVGAIDPGFGREGVLRLESLAFDLAPSSGLGVLLLRSLPAGGVLAGGGTRVAAFLAEVGPEGRPDDGFGSGGILTVTRPRRALADAQAISANRGGDILALGETDAGGETREPTAAVFRFRPGGAVDRRFGGGRGYLRVPGTPKGLAVDRRGRALVLAGTHPRGTVMRVGANGQLDPSFGSGGIATLPGYPPGSAKDPGQRLGLIPRRIAALPGGGALVSAWAVERSGSRIELIKLTGSGRLDRSFGHGGVALIDVGHRVERDARAMVVLPDGGILLGGLIAGVRYGRWRQVAALIRLRPDGSLDTSFGRRGLTTVPLRGKGVVTALAVGARGEILTVGRQYPRGRYSPLLERFTASGHRDRRFARRAARSLRVLGEGELSPKQVLLWSGRIVISGYGSPSVFICSRSGQLERKLVLGGRLRSKTKVRGAALQEGRLVVVTKTAGSHAFTLRRLLLPR